MLLLVAVAAAAALGLGVLGLLRGTGRVRKRLERRMRSLRSEHVATTTRIADVVLAKATAQEDRWHRVLARVQAIVGYDPVPSRPMPDWVALLLALIVARGITWLLVALGGPVGWFGFPVAAVLVIRAYFGWCTRRWREELFRQFPDALSTIVRTVRVGVSMADGIRRVASEAPEPTASIFRQITSALAIGTPLTEAMMLATKQTGVAEYHFFTTALVLQSRTGGGLAATLEGLADVIRKRVMVRARGKALAAEARASSVVLALLPVLVVIGLLVINPGYMAELFITTTGHTLLSMACVSEGIGILIMRTMIVRSLS
jgi:tight adherence protein B